MIRSVAAGLLFWFAIVSSASAQTCSVPNTLTNGTNADATQVMANFNALLTCVNSQAAAAAPRSYLAGLTLSTAGSSANFGIAVGVATSDDATTSINLPISSAKTTGAWAVGSGSGSLDTGSIANNTWYHVFLIERTDTGVVDVLISQSLTSPTLPASYTKKRRIGSMKTDGSAHWVSFVQLGDDFLWSVATQDFNGAFGTAASLVTLNVPTGVQVEAKIQGLYVSGTLASLFLITSPDQADTAPSLTDFSLIVPLANQNSSFDLRVRTNTSAQIRGRANVAASTFWCNTYGWIDHRGRDN